MAQVSCQIGSEPLVDDSSGGNYDEEPPGTETRGDGILVTMTGSSGQRRPRRWR